ncbi:MAG: ATP-binding protein [Chloroflexota bacterium]|nr:ATP-binding protein [Chloroflexota bacterium]
MAGEDPQDEYKFSSVHAPDLSHPLATLYGSRMLRLLLQEGGDREQVCLGDIRVHPAAAGLSLEALPFRNVLATPILWGGLTRAVLLLARRQPDAFSASDAEFVRLLVAQAGAAFYNSDLLNEVRQRSEIAQQRAYLLETLIGSIAEPVFIAAMPGVIIDANERGLEVLGMTRDEITRPLGEYVSLIEPRHPDGRLMPVEEQPLMRALRGETFDSVQLMFHKVGQLAGETDSVYSFSGAPVRNSGGEIILAVAVGHDITGERKLARLREEFLSVASHELKTPLTVVKANAQLLARTIEKLDDPKLKRRSTSLIEHIDRMHKLVDLLLDISRLESGRLSVDTHPLDLCKLVRQTVDGFTLASPRSTLVVNLPKCSVCVQGDPLRLEQVLSNLLGNAARYSPDDSDLRVDLTEEDRVAHVSVTDQGIGIPEEELPRIFDRYYQVPGSPGALGGSMGMGLYISRSIIEAHGGRIWADSRLGHGSTSTSRCPPSPATPADSVPDLSIQH